MKSRKNLTSLGLLLILSVGIFSAACIRDRPLCNFCGFNSREMVQDVNTGAIYTTDDNGCVTIDSGDCGRFDIEPLIGPET